MMSDQLDHSGRLQYRALIQRHVVAVSRHVRETAFCFGTVDKQLVKMVHSMAWQESGGNFCVESNFVKLKCQPISNYPDRLFRDLDRPK